MTLSLEETYRALHNGVVARASTRDVVLVSGPDALSFLQGQCTQDVSALSIGESVESLLLSPQGKFEAYVRVVLIAPDVAVLASAAGSGELVYERLRRFKIRVKADLESASWPTLELRGPDASAAAAMIKGATYVAKIDWPGLSGLDLVGPELVPTGEVEAGDEAAFEAARVEAGWPETGRELTEKTIPQEAGIEARTVSFTKGCYTGQELVARLDARGNRVPWHLRGLTFAEATAPADGAVVVLDGREIGRLTSSAYSPGRAVMVGLAYLRRDTELPVEVIVSDGLRATASELPLV